MALDSILLERLREHHSGWRLLCSPHAPLIAGFLHRTFIDPNVRHLPQADLIEALEDELFAARARKGPHTFPGSPQSYLNDWADNDKGWLRKWYPSGTDEPHFDLTPATEKALTWLESLTERSFVGTESRLLTLFELLRQMVAGSQANPELRLAELQRQRDEIDTQMARIHSGDIPLLDDTALKDRFQQWIQIARDLLSDFREVEQNFRRLDCHVRERIALWEGDKGSLLEEVMGARDAITDSDQGKSFRAFWDFLMSQSRQEELSQQLEQVLALAPIQSMHPDPRLQRIHYDWLEAGEHTQRTVAKLSEQLRRFLDDQARIEHRRIMDLLQRIEQHALKVRATPPPGACMTLEEPTTMIELPLERPLYRPPLQPLLASATIEEGEAMVDTALLYAQVRIDRGELISNIRHELRTQQQVSLGDVIARYPLRHGLAELVTYLQIAGEWPSTAVFEAGEEQIRWCCEGGLSRQATLPRILLLQETSC